MLSEFYLRRMQSNLAFFRRVPLKVISSIKRLMGFSWLDLIKCKFTFDESQAAGTHFVSFNCLTRKMSYHINIDESRLDDLKKDLRNPFYFVLGHELQHMRQYMVGDLMLSSVPNDKALYWKYKRHVDTDLSAAAVTYEEYKISPWEQEADAVAHWLVAELIERGLIEDHALLPPGHHVYSRKR